MATLTCANKGCGKSFVESDNHETSCEHHPGAPVFHEGLKGWSCCSKRVTDFDDFLKIQGCSVGKHSTHAAAEPAATPTSAASAPVSTDLNGKEVYGSVPPHAAAAAPATQDSFQPKHVEKEPETKEQDLHDSADAVIAFGTQCKRRGCGHVYVDESSRAGECIFHPGAPIFHEGSKGWSCCSRKVLEFEEFVKIQGCTKGNHRFLDSPKASAEEYVECRRDWYQTQTSVIISVFAKKVDKASTTCVFKEGELLLEGKLADGKRFKYHTPLVQPITPELSKYEVLSTKVEITLRKANGISWPSIEPRTDIVSFTTFGTTGTVGTIGGKTALVAEDAPVHLLKKQ
ncbi:chord-domain-containing protein [Cladochytrium replicatum]|nr:chord-domain-containing protein [Cladochytrium replicatum]